MRIDAANVLSGMRRRIGEISEHLLLGLDNVAHPGDSLIDVMRGRGPRDIQDHRLPEAHS
jgi:hypothetical protein